MYFFPSYFFGFLMTILNSCYGSMFYLDTCNSKHFLCVFKYFCKFACTSTCLNLSVFNLFCISRYCMLSPGLDSPASFIWPLSLFLKCGYLLYTSPPRLGVEKATFLSVAPQIEQRSS